MKKRLLLSTLVASSLLLGFTVPVGAQMAGSQEPAKFPTVSLPPLPFFEPIKGFQVTELPKGVIEGPHFRGGDTVVITEDLKGDVYAGGGTVTIDSTIYGDLMVGGGTVIINGMVTDDIRAAGGNVVINGSVGKNVTVAGGSVSFGPNSVVGGSIVVGSGTSSFNGNVAGNVWLGSGNVSLAGVFNQDVTVNAETLSMNNKATIGGSLKAEVAEPAAIAEGASISGEKQIKVNEERQRERHRQQQSPLLGLAAAGWFGQAVMGMLMTFVGAVALWYFLPTFTKEVTTQAKLSPLGKMGWGFAYLILAPVAAVVVMMTVVGLPLGFIGLMLYVIDMMIAGWVAAIAFGQYIYARSKKEWLEHPVAQIGAGVVSLGLVGLVPVVGWVIKFVAFLIGLGSLAVWSKEYISQVTAVRASAKGKHGK